MTRDKAAGEDGITVALIKDGVDILEKLAALYTERLTSSSVRERTEKMPALYQSVRRIEQLLIKELNNYRPISFLSVFHKIFIKIISNRIRETLDFNEPREQAVFRKGYFTMDPIEIINQVIEKPAEYNNQPL